MKSVLIHVNQTCFIFFNIINSFNLNAQENSIKLNILYTHVHRMFIQWNISLVNEKFESICL